MHFKRNAFRKKMSKKEFECPSCVAPMNFGGGESIFQTCESCHAPIVVPSDIFYPADRQIASGNFATLTNDVKVDPEQVTNELTAGDKPPSENEVIDPEAKIEKFEIYQEKIGASSVAAKEAFDNIVSSSDDLMTDSHYSSTVENTVVDESKSVLERIKSELLTGDKIEAIKIYCDAFGKSLAEAKDIVEAIEREELSRVKKVNVRRNVPVK